MNRYLKYVYVSGPITRGDHFLNARNGIVVSEEIRKLGFMPFCPHLSSLWQMVAPGASYEEWMTYDLAWLEKCDAILRLPGDSPGADREVGHATYLGIPVVGSVEELVDMDLLLTRKNGL